MPEGIELLIPILAVLFFGVIVLVPIAGLTMRFALKPAVEAYARLKETQAPAAGTEQLRALEQRLAAVEEQVRNLASAQASVQPLRAAPDGLIAEPTTGPS